MPRKHIKDHQKTLNIQRGATPPVVNPTEDKAVDERRDNRHPEFLQETMFQEHGTRVLITNPKADQYLSDGEEKEDTLERMRERVNKDAQHAKWLEENM